MTARAALKLGLYGTGALGVAGSCVVSGVGVWASRTVNSKRPRFATDNYVLTPEELKMPYKHHQLTTEDDVSLSGWIIEQSRGGRPSSRVIVFFHRE